MDKEFVEDLRKNFQELERIAVYGDILSERGDPGGELVGICLKLHNNNDNNEENKKLEERRKELEKRIYGDRGYKVVKWNWGIPVVAEVKKYDLEKLFEEEPFIYGFKGQVNLEQLKDYSERVEYLSLIGIGDGGAEHISRLKGLKRLYLGGNQIGDGAKRELIEIFANRVSL